MQHVDLVRKTALILKCLAHAPNGLGVRELADQVDLPKSTAQRLLQGLAEVELVSQVPTSRRYRLGPLNFHLGNAFRQHIDIRNRSLPYMTRLHGITSETVGLNVRAGLESRLLVEQIESRSELIARAELGQYPIWRGAPGRVFLADLTEHQKNLLCDYTHNEDLSQDIHKRIEHAVEELHEHGLARAVNDVIAGLTTIAAPVRDGTGRTVAALGISWPSHRSNDSAMQLNEDALRKAADDLSHDLGFMAASRASLTER